MQEKKERNLFHIWLVMSCILIVIGIIFIYSSSSILASEHYQDPFYFVKKQLVGLVIGMVALIAAASIPTHYLERYAFLIFLASLTLVIFTLIPTFSLHLNGSSRWLKIAKFSFQPSELLKIGLVLYLAATLKKKQYRKDFLSHCYLPLLFIIGVVSIILLKQPDFGLTVTLGCTALILFFLSHVPARYLLVTIGSTLPIFATLIIFKPYRFKRILTFLNPWEDPQGSGFQIIQSLIAIGSGGVTGVGIGQSKQKLFYLPMQHTDFIFSIIAEETGLLGTSLLIALCIIWTYAGFSITHSMRNYFSYLAAAGFISLISLQIIINIAVATGSAPTKGIGFPFVSYGNSSLVATMMIVGIIIGMYRNNKSEHHASQFGQ